MDMGYPNLQAAVADLERTGQLVRLEKEIDPHLEAAAIHRRVYAAGGPALFFTRVKGCAFPMASNLFGTLERARFLFRDTLETVHRLMELKADPSAVWKRFWSHRGLVKAGWNARPKFVRSGAVFEQTTSLGQLPRLQCWPNDGGAFVTLPTVYTEDGDRPGWRHSNLGMYRIQISGNKYVPDRQAGMHYQIHRGIGVHHAKALAKGVPLRVNVFVGGPPALSIAAVMPLPEGMPELAFAGVLGGRRMRLCEPPEPNAMPGLPVAADADFCISGTVGPEMLPEGPFGDHLGYYSLGHPFPVLTVERVWNRAGAIWLFTVVGRPPQEDTTFGAFIHELTGPVIPSVIRGVHAIHAVDAAGVHPLLLAIGSERYTPYAERRKPQELLTCANAILGQGQLSLAKYLLIVAKEDAPDLDVQDVPGFLRHLLERVDWRSDLHFQTSTTIDTLDYSGGALNEGSKVVIAAAGRKRRELATKLPSDLRLPSELNEPRLAVAGAMVVQGPPFGVCGQAVIAGLCEAWHNPETLSGISLIVVVDDSGFAAATLNNWLWVTFTRSNPAADIHGVAAFTLDKHWGCHGPLVIDARIKPHHAPVLEEDSAVTKRVEAMAARGGPLHGLF
jgi:4-hydroxy-3-polyprenylbenzoate decarboxylase